MDHTHAVDSQAVERYLLGELPEAEREEFEKHYFECPECASSVEAGNVFVENARAVFGEAPTKREAQRSWLQEFIESLRQPMFALPSLAAVAFAAIALYQALVVVPRLKQGLETPRVLPAFQLIGPSRGEGTVIEVSRNSPAFSVAFDIAPEFQFPQYEAALSRSEGAVPVFQISALAPAAGQPITILLPTMQLSPGQYTLDVTGGSGGNRAPVAKYSFTLRFRE